MVRPTRTMLKKMGITPPKRSKPAPLKGKIKSGAFSTFKEASNIGKLKRVPKKFMKDEEKYVKLIEKNKPISEKQLLSFSKAIKINQRTNADGFINLNTFNNAKGSLTHGKKELDELGYNPKKLTPLIKRLYKIKD